MGSSFPIYNKTPTRLLCFAPLSRAVDLPLSGGGIAERKKSADGFDAVLRGGSGGLERGFHRLVDALEDKWLAHELFVGVEIMWPAHHCPFYTAGRAAVPV